MRQGATFLALLIVVLALWLGAGCDLPPPSPRIMHDDPEATTRPIFRTGWRKVRDPVTGLWYWQYIRID